MLSELGRLQRVESDQRPRQVKDMAVALNNAGLTRRNGKPWIARQVSAILARRPFYYDGMLSYGEASGQSRALALF